MRRFALTLCLLLSLASAALAYTEDEASRLDALFAALARAETPDAARIIDRQIWEIWTNPADAEIARRMDEVDLARMEGRLDHVRDLLDDIVADFPDYAEGWNQRATVEFMMGDYAASLADIDAVLALEPRHFGALSGQAMIYDHQGRRDLAVATMRRALAIHPFLVERGRFPELDANTTRA